jgi:5-(carboxyamino)imidazole ribonucleotide synthase
MLISSDKTHTLTLGILGGGQLAKMLAIEAYRLGLNVAIIDKDENTPAGDMSKLDFNLGWNDAKSLAKFIEVSDIIILENEFIPTEIMKTISLQKKVYPTAKTMELVQDKFKQKTIFSKNGIYVPIFSEISNVVDMKRFGNKYNYPFLIKTRTLGYDGYGNFNINNSKDCDKLWDKFGYTADETIENKFMAEQFVDFKMEVAVMVARSRNEVAVYPCVETIQKNNICHQVIVPARIDIDIAEQAKEIAIKAVEAISGIGVFGVEMFVTNESQLLLNEIAPRPHNSGHYTIEACYCSQYENAIRAICNLPLGSTEMIKPAACMINLLGQREGTGVPKKVNETLKFKHSKLHLYNKKQSRIGRKMGHITTIADKVEYAIKEATEAYNSFKW